MISPYAAPGGGPPKTSRLKPWHKFVLGLALAVTVGTLAGRLLGPVARQLVAAGHYAVGDTPPDFRAATLGGGELSLAQLRGKVVVLDFWATWCGPCMAELPQLLATHSRFAANPDVVMVGVSLDSDRADLERTIAARRIAWPQVFDQDLPSPLADQFGVYAIPYSLVIGRDGRIVASDVAGRNLAAAIDLALAAGS